MKRKIIAIGLALLMSANVTSIAEVTTEATAHTQDGVEEAANRLNQIDILRGDGSGFDLDGKLTRAQGATFIVRLLGMDEEVTNNKIDYVAMNFSDVFGNDWYSAYVGYCVQEGIINGYTDGTFRPNDTLNEQAFIKMILGAMGYEYGVDFNWNGTFAFAYEKGVVTDDKYKGMTASSGAYTRGQVVELLDHVISQPMKDEGKDMVDLLVDRGLLTREDAIFHGYIADNVLMEVDELSMTPSGQFRLLLSEAPSNLTKDHIVIKGKNSDTRIEVSEILEMEIARSFALRVDEQVPDEEYVMTLTGLEDSQGNVMDDYSFEFFGYRSDTFESAYYRIVKADLVKADQLDIYFTHPVDINQIRPEDIELDRAGTPFISGNDSLFALSVDSSNPYLLHVELLAFDINFADSFIVKVSGDVKSLYGAKVYDGHGDSARFASVEVESEDFMLKDVVMEDDQHIVLRFNQNLRKLTAEQKFSYELKNAADVSLEIQKAELIMSGDYAGKAVRLTSDLSITAGNTYKLMINQAYNTDRSESIIEEMTSFVARLIELPELKIISAKLTDGDRLEVVVDHYLDESAVTDNSLYSIKDKTTGFYVAKPTKIHYDKYTKNPTLALEFKNDLVFTNGHEYSLIIESGMKVAGGQAIKAAARTYFTAVSAQYKDLMLDEASYIGGDIIKISASKELAVDVPNVLNTNYSLEEIDGDAIRTLQPIGVTYFSSHAILLRFEDLDPSLTYSLRADKLISEFGETQDVSKREIGVGIEDILQ